MNITALYNKYQEKSNGLEGQNINSLVAACVLHIIGHYFAHWTKSFVLTLSYKKEHTNTFYADVLDKVFASWNEWSLHIVEIHKGQRHRVEDSGRFNMLLVESYESFLWVKIIF